MANTRELRRRIKSVKNTAQITKAMQMVAATKMRRAQNQAISGRPYITALKYALTKLQTSDDQTHPLLETHETGKIGILLLSTDRALCGALNTNVFRQLQQFLKEKVGETVFYTLGQKGRQFSVRMGKNLAADFENKERVEFKDATSISKLLIDTFLTGELKEVYIAYPNFISTLRQEPRVRKLLSIDKQAIIEELARELNELKDDQEDQEFLFEPDLTELLDYVLIHSIETQVYQAILETKASEHSARMMAMQNATDNAHELVQDLQLAYNQTRQEGITRELLEITSAQAALE